jgi:hypothetical protein
VQFRRDPEKLDVCAEWVLVSVGAEGPDRTAAACVRVCVRVMRACVCVCVCDGLAHPVRGSGWSSSACVAGSNVPLRYLRTREVFVGQAVKQ